MFCTWVFRKCGFFTYINTYVRVQYVILYVISEKGDGEYKLPISSGHEVWKICPWPEADFENAEAGQGETCHHC